MSGKPRVGHVKTFSSSLGSGSVEVTYSGNLVSLPFTTRVIEGGAQRQLHSGDRVRVSLSSGRDKQPRVVAIEAAPAEPLPENSPGSDNAGTAAPGSITGEPIQVPVLEGVGTPARFTVANFRRSGSRLDFG